MRSTAIVSIFEEILDIELIIQDLLNTGLKKENIECYSKNKTGLLTIDKLVVQLTKNNINFWCWLTEVNLTLESLLYFQHIDKDHIIITVIADSENTKGVPGIFLAHSPLEINEQIQSDPISYDNKIHYYESTISEEDLIKKRRVAVENLLKNDITTKIIISDDS